MKRNIIFNCFFAIMVFFLASCNDPVFYVISTDVRPLEPIIKGVPTNFAVYDGALYVASGRVLYKYWNNNPDDTNNPAIWYGGESVSAVPQPAVPGGGSIIQIASTGNYLYALCFSDSGGGSSARSILQRYNGAEWEELNVETGVIMLNIFAANDYIFIKTQIPGGGFRVMYAAGTVSAGTAIMPLMLNNEPFEGNITGAVFDGSNYYICTSQGIFKAPNPASGVTIIYRDDSPGIQFIGMINLETANNIIALITRGTSSQGARLYLLQDDNLTLAKVDATTDISLGNRIATGALAIYRTAGDQKLLLAGRQDRLNYIAESGFSYGYLELEIDSNGIKTETSDDGVTKNKNFVEPGRNSPSTVGTENVERYTFRSTIGKHPVNYLFQAPSDIDREMILFASTQKNGVWSYRDRSGKGQWNAEDNKLPR
ncbi:MAG: hypothetical protein LBH16_12370 [Treponema sp.]|jgi:hypothetical protein|nr:hypothetical protein [Treponema sp.]